MYRKYFWQGYLFVLGDSPYLAWGLCRLHSEAQNFCQKQDKNLASFVSQDDIECMKGRIEQVESQNESFWTGLRCTTSNGTWSFIDGADTTFAASKVNLTSCVNSDLCVMIHRDGRFSVTLCDTRGGFVCRDPPMSNSTG